MICTNRSFIELLVNEPDKSSRLFERLAGEWLSIHRVMTLARLIAAGRYLKKRVKSRASSLVRFAIYFSKQGYFFFKRLFNAPF